MIAIESPWVSGPTNYLGFTIPYDGTQSSVDKAYVQRYIDLYLKDDSVKNNAKKVTIAEGFAPPGQWQTYAGVFSSSNALDPCKELGMVEVEVKSPSVSYYLSDIRPNVVGFAKVEISQKYGGGNTATLRDNHDFVRSTCDRFVLNAIPTTSGGMSLDIWHAYTWTIPPRVLKVMCPVDLALENSDGAAFISSMEYDMDEFIIQNLVSSINIKFMVLTRDQCVAFFNALGTASTQQTITLNATTYASLSTADIAIATGKNFSVVSA